MPDTEVQRRADAREDWSQLAVTRNALIGVGICFAIAFGAVMDIFFSHFVLWVGLGMGVSAAVAYLVQKRTDRGTYSGSSGVRSLSFKNFLIIFFGLVVLGVAGAIVSLVYAMQRAVS